MPSLVPSLTVCVYAFSCPLSVSLCVSDLIKEVLSLDDEIQRLAAELYQQKSVLIMGRGYHYATCLEGALVSTPTSISPS